MKRITITLNKEQEQYFNELKYSLMDMEATNSDVINHVLMEALLFEKFTEDQITNYIIGKYPEKYQEAIKSGDFGIKFKTSVPD